MELFPELRLDWFNGWIFIVISYSIFFLLILTCSKEVREKGFMMRKVGQSHKKS